uniref:Uncharacterized protein n=1 Tax=viral metagenome TaxID=1070528 RepID=A0A6C0KGH8_9ZZZZ
MPPLRRDVIYPIFLKCLPFVEDEFWKETFEELSYGNCYQGSYLSKGFLCCNVKGKEFIYKFLDKEPQRIYNDISKLLKEKLNIMSKNDRKILIHEFEELEQHLKILKQTEWNDIKKKSVKDILFQNYLIKHKKENELRDSQIRCLYHTINLGMMLKSIKNTDIVYHDGEIFEIKGITFAKGKYKIDIDIYSGLDEEVSKVSEKKDEKLLRHL